MEIEVRFCKECNKDKEHVGVIVKPQYQAKIGKKEKIKEFLSALVAGWGAGPTAGFMELRDLHLICKTCGHKIIERYRGDIG
ncbi:hypothetical protein [Thalassotalea aquiviva]|uniref:hypothetical protein n=1 Tax=Thalassotalea aquiviva TaxID=3242415 RepID=UPI00352A3C66